MPFDVPPLPNTSVFSNPLSDHLQLSLIYTCIPWHPSSRAILGLFLPSAVIDDFDLDNIIPLAFFYCLPNFERYSSI